MCGITGVDGHIIGMHISTYWQLMLTIFLFPRISNLNQISYFMTSTVHSQNPHTGINDEFVLVLIIIRNLSYVAYGVYTSPVSPTSFALI